MCITPGPAQLIVQPNRDEILPAMLRLLAALEPKAADPAAWRLNIEVWCIKCEARRRRIGRPVRPVYTVSEFTEAEMYINEAFEALLDLGHGIVEAVEKVRLECELADHPQDPDFWAYLAN